MWWPLYVFNLCSSFFWAFNLFCFPSWVASLSVSSVSPPYLGHILCIIFCVSHFMCHILCVTIYASHYVHHMCITYLSNMISLWMVIVSWLNCDKYCMAHGCATRKNEGLLYNTSLVCKLVMIVRPPKILITTLTLAWLTQIPNTLLRWITNIS